MAERPPGCCLPGKPARRLPPEIPPARQGSRQGPAKMVAMPCGWFRMGAADGPHPEDGEGPVRDVFVDSFALAATAVTIAEFAEFVKSTGYRTLAERVGSSFVFHAFCDPETDFPVMAQAPWWRHVPGAFWGSPDGPDSCTRHRRDHPVTHVAREDALAYCHWSGTRLPTEAEWECAARGGRVGEPFPWGVELEQGGIQRSNVWQGKFPDDNTCDDGFEGTAPVTAYDPNGSGFYNMTGNVWEWVSDRFTDLHSPRPVRNPKGPLNGTTLVAKGGSYLCHASYCKRYRVSSRQQLAADTTTGNLGFRVASAGT
ncbi:MAG: formylglycine-generating enzyme family protein [Rhodobacteraceae bacterium]|nr:formylglycine-generating enzyme family protein [Paracoccaceae bacterium]MCY4139656.1 formylglycine-generating enzyme family protein [Paracoccaceae bacterium]